MLKSGWSSVLCCIFVRSGKLLLQLCIHKLAGNWDSDRQFGESRSNLFEHSSDSSTAKTAVQIQHVNRQDLKKKRQLKGNPSG